MINISVAGSQFEQTALSIFFGCLTWVILACVLALLIRFKKDKEVKVIVIVLTMVNIFSVLGGVVCSMPFYL